jgi:isochorismate synthase
MRLNNSAFNELRDSVIGCPSEWCAVTIEIDSPPSLLNMLASCGVEPLIYFSPPNQITQYAGFGAWEIFTNAGAKLFLETVADTNIILLGGNAFDGSIPTLSMAQEWWVLPVCTIIQTKQYCQLRVACHASKENRWDTVAAILNEMGVNNEIYNDTFYACHHNPKKSQWVSSIESVKQLFQCTPLEKVVLARESCFRFHKPINPFLMMIKIQSHDPGLYHFVIQFSKDLAFIGGTPERLFEINQGCIESDAIAGTIRNTAGGAQLLARQKDAKEHQYVSAYILHAMATLCNGEIEYNRECQLLELKIVSHLIQTFKGTLKPGRGPMDGLAVLHPTPAVAGTPTPLALDIISTFESFSRGWYAGPVGVLAHQQSTVVVAIRSGVVSGDTVTVYAGAGIVNESNPESEWDELNAKISGFEALFHP